MAKKNVVISCPKCGTVIQAEYGLFSNTVRCPECKTKINISQESVQTVECANCHNNVIFDARKGDDQLCPVCRQPLKNKVAERKIEKVSCPYCGQYQEANIQETDRECTVCKKHFSPKQRWEIMQTETMPPIVIEPAMDSDYLMWQYADSTGKTITRFAYASRLVVPEGMTALLLRNGVCQKAVPPGSYLLSDSRFNLTDQLIDAVNNPGAMISMQIYFVKKQFRDGVRFADPPVPVEDADGVIEGEVSAAGIASIRVSDAKAFAEFVGYENHTEAGLINSGSIDGQPSKLRTTLRTSAFIGTVQAAQELIRKNRWTADQLQAHKDDVQQAAPSYVTQRLSGFGLEAAQISLVNFTCAENKNRYLIRQYTEQRGKWVSRPMTIHMKDDPVLSAELILEGTFKLRIREERVYMRRSEIVSWLKNGATEQKVMDYCAETVNELLKNVQPNVIQPFIDNYDADICELSRYYHVLRSTAQEYLNKQLESYGLEVEQFVMEERSLVLSSALKNKRDLKAYRVDSETFLEKHDIDNQVELHRAISDTQAALERDSLQVKAELKLDENNALREQLNNQRATRQAGYTLEGLDRQHQLVQHQRELDHREMDDEDAYQHGKAVKQAQDKEEIDALNHASAMRATLRSAEVLRAEWEQKKALEEAQLDAEIRQAEKVQAADIRFQHTQAQASRQEEISEADSKRMLNEIMRKIAESDLEVREKLDAYERLCRNNAASDRLNQQIAAAAAESDALYARGHTKLTLSKEENELLEAMKRQAEERDERRKQAEFQREMQREEAQVLHEMEKLKLEADQAQREDEMKERLANQEAEISKLRLMLDYYAAADRQNAQVQAARITADAARAKAEREYELNKAQAAREEAAKQERAERDDKFGTQAERLLTRMWEIQGALDKMRIETEQKQVEGQTQVGVANTRATSGNTDALIKAMEKMTRTVNGTLRDLQKQKAGWQPRSYTAQPTSPAFTPPPSPFGDPTRPVQASSAERICPKCGRPVSKYSTLCVCGQYLG